MMQAARRLRDGDDEDEIEQKLERCGDAVRFVGRARRHGRMNARSRNDWPIGHLLQA